MKTKTKAAAAFVCGLFALLTANIDWVFVLSCALGMAGAILARSAMKADDVSPSGRGMAVAGTLTSLFAVCIAFGAILGYTVAYFM